ncbi:hypothetical protein FRC04_011991 [Tulasnella sp. 424]|nr:hypothetical protein FRC04_011991 [Tulasnella sp. 424]KAG8971309.1 hypothetical protein FRC05_011301 [Tulasnella sp. 425]
MSNTASIVPVDPEPPAIVLVDPESPAIVPVDQAPESEFEEGTNKILNKICDLLKRLPDIKAEEACGTTRLWRTYQKEAAEYDTELLNRYNKSLDTVLIFAGLFSAVNTSFITFLQPGLSQDPNEMTHALLRLMIHTISNSTFTDSDVSLPIWLGPPTSAIWTQSILYASLATCLLSAFGATMGKQWLEQYAEVDVRGNEEERGLSRQRKLDGATKWGCTAALDALPLLLQVNLFLFGLAICTWLWSQQNTIGSVVIGATATGFLFYLSLLISSIAIADFPFKPPFSRFVHQIFRSITSICCHTVEKCWSKVKPFVPAHTPADTSPPSGCTAPIGSKILNCIRFRLGLEMPDHNVIRVVDFWAALSWDESLKGHPYLVRKVLEPSALTWLLTVSTDSSVFLRVMPFLEEFYWPSGAESRHILRRLYYILTNEFAFPNYKGLSNDQRIRNSKVAICLMYSIPQNELRRDRYEIEPNPKEPTDKFLTRETGKRLQAPDLPEALEPPRDIFPWTTYLTLLKLYDSEREESNTELVNQAFEDAILAISLRPLLERRYIANSLTILAVVLGLKIKRPEALIPDKSPFINQLAPIIMWRVRQILTSETTTDVAVRAINLERANRTQIGLVDILSDDGLVNGLMALSPRNIQQTDDNTSGLRLLREAWSGWLRVILTSSIDGVRLFNALSEFWGVFKDADEQLQPATISLAVNRTREIDGIIAEKGLGSSWSRTVMTAFTRISSDPYELPSDGQSVEIMKAFQELFKAEWFDADPNYNLSNIAEDWIRQKGPSTAAQEGESATQQPDTSTVTQESRVPVVQSENRDSGWDATTPNQRRPNYSLRVLRHSNVM